MELPVQDRSMNYQAYSVLIQFDYYSCMFLGVGGCNICSSAGVLEWQYCCNLSIAPCTAKITPVLVPCIIFEGLSINLYVGMPS